MAWRKHEVFNKVQPFHIQPSPHNFSAVGLAEVRKVIRSNDFPLQFSGLHDAAFQPAQLYPPLYLLGSDMKSLGKGVLREPILSHSRTHPEPMQHGTDGARRSTHRNSDFRQGLSGNQIQ